jgi:hypothetical protein
MEKVFGTLQEFMTFSKGVTYIIMAGILILLPLYWKFITGRDEKNKTF